MDAAKNEDMSIDEEVVEVQAWSEKKEAPEKTKDLTSRDEKNQQQALNDFYAKASKKGSKNGNERKIRLCKTFARTIYPMFCIAFIAGFWLTGMVVYNKDN